ncbi:PA14 domain-containing protein [Lacihabitans sp. LS3-19]|uniref:PA14 domain-containing protein n=1 Tax=Lacihabitans sp. LS3-19 TaxID=2487335 RepID=UPI0020CD8B2A|nr:PA14 domain-containing protein [Lacihabitans sp. LS3-19]
MKKRFVFYVLLFAFSIHSVHSQSLLDDENPVDLNAWKNASWREVSDLSIAPISKKAEVKSGKGAILADGNASMVFPEVNQSYILSFDCKMEPQSIAHLALTNENKLSLAISEFGSILTNGIENRPDVNAARALGLWQNVEISVDKSKNLPGFITVNFVKVNNLIVLQHIILPAKDLEKNHLKFEVSNGKFALKNLKILEQSDIKPITLTDLKGEIWEDFDWDKISTEGRKSMAKAEINALNYDIGQGLSRKNFIAKYDGVLNVDKAGIYNFMLDISGKFMLTIDNELIFPFDESFSDRQRFSKKVNLKEGKHDFHLEYLKVWMRPALGLSVSGNGAKSYALNDLTSLPEIKNYGNIKLNPKVQTEVIRGFYMHNGVKNTTALAAGFTSKLNYAIDIEKGSLMTIWKGNFTDMTEMWHERGEPQTFKADGMYVNFSGKDILLDQNNKPVSINYLGQEMDSDNSPIFEYQTEQGLGLTEQILPMNAGFNVMFNFKNTSNTNLVLGRSKEIVKVEKGVYKVGDCYIQINEKLKAQIVQIDDESVLLVPATNSVSYNLIW